MPEIAAIGFVGAVFTFIFVNLNLYAVHKSFQKKKFRNLNTNLQKVGFYWSQDQAQLVAISDSDRRTIEQADYTKSVRSAFIFGTILIFLSWFGLLIFLIYYFSITKLARPRMERIIFESPLTLDDNLDPSRVQAILENLKQSV